MTRPQFEPGETVRTATGEVRRVIFQQGCMVILDDGARWHPAKLRPVPVRPEAGRDHARV